MKSFITITNLALVDAINPCALAVLTLMLIAIITYNPKGDGTLVSASSEELKKYGWNLPTGNTPAAYLVGLLIGKRALAKKIKEAVLDIGLQTPVKGGRVFALLKGDIGESVRMGWTMHWDQPYLWALLLIGALSQGTGFFGTLVFLDKNENTYCIPVNRSSSILAGIIAAFLLSICPFQLLETRAEMDIPMTFFSLLSIYFLIS